jgi:SAM-dependent methyltransferase
MKDMDPDLVPAAAVIAHPAWRLGNLLDIRSPAAFAAGHLAGACNVPLPAADARGRPTLEPWLLPPRHEPLLVIAADPGAAHELVAALRSQGRPHVSGCLLAGGGLASLPPDAVETGSGRPGLWRAPAFLLEHAGLLPPPALGPVLDLGCGSGRGAVWLALRGHRVAAVDRDEEALSRLRRLAQRSGVPEGRITCHALDLRRPQALPPGPWAGAVMIRFVSRPLLARLPELILPGGIVIVRALRAEGSRPDSGRPERQHRVAPGELPRLLPDPPFELLLHREDDDPDGRVAAGGVFRRRA